MKNYQNMIVKGLTAIIQKFIILVKNERNLFKYYICIEENFQIIHSVRLEIDHRDGNVMLREEELVHCN